jgi:hypothetical protein
LEEALRRGSSVGIAEVYRELVLTLEKFRAGLQATIAGKTIISDPYGTWTGQAHYICRDILSQAALLLEEGGAGHRGNPL